MMVTIVVFPGTNREHDMRQALEHCGAMVNMAWYADTHIARTDLIVLPGGFSFGDYLRCGAVAARAPIMREVVRLAQDGTPVLGICNGFQILIESGLLPGALLQNRNLGFICRMISVRLENAAHPFTDGMKTGDVMRIPIAHGEGNYFADPEICKRLEDGNRIVFRYTGYPSAPGDEINPNGSTNAIAGIINENGNVLGMMPHPENAVLPRRQSSDGLAFLQGMVEALS